MPENIRSIGCEFTVYRQRKRSKIISISLWKASPGYIYNLSTSILWWGVNANQLYPDWNVRFYIDYSVYQKHMKDDVDWENIIDQAKKHKNIEIWMTFCPWGHDPKDKCKKCHINTFMSMIRFHPMIDPEVDIVVVRNIELLSGPKDSRLIHDWIGTRKKYYCIYDPSYFCWYSEKICEETKMTNTNMIYALFGIKNSHETREIFTKISRIIFDYTETSKYIYGVDEIVLTFLFKPLLDRTNTYLILRTRSNQWIPTDNRNYDIIFSYIASIINNREIYTQEELTILQLLLPSMDLTSDPLELIPEYSHRLNSQVSSMLGTISTSMPNLTMKIFRKLKDIILPFVNIQKINNIFKSIQNFYFNTFKNNIRIKAVDFFENCDSEEQALLYVYTGINALFFEDIDWPGLPIKSKTGIPLPPEEKKLSSSELKRNINALKKRYTMTRRPVPPEEKLKEEAKQTFENQYKKDIETYRKNMTIFTQNIRNNFLSQDSHYSD